MESATAAPRKPKAGRHNYLVDRTFQLKYTVILVVVGAAISMLFGAMMYQAHVEVTQLLDLPDPRLRAMVSAHDDTLLYLVVAISAVMAVALGLFGVLVTHRVAGPIYVLSHYMSVLSEGRYPLVRPLRRRDELKSFFEIFNQAVAMLKDRDRLDGEEIGRAVAAVESVAAKSPEHAAALAGAVEALKRVSQRRLEAAASEDPATPGQRAEAGLA